MIVIIRGTQSVIYEGVKRVWHTKTLPEFFSAAELNDFSRADSSHGTAYIHLVFHNGTFGLFLVDRTPKALRVLLDNGEVLIDTLN